jgi:hypothetical protein
MGFIAATLVVASFIHLVGDVQGRTDLYDPTDAGIAEAIIAGVLVAGIVGMIRSPRRARAIGITAVGFATIGFIVGLSITARSAHVPDITYHLSILPLLVVSLVVLVRAGPAPVRPGCVGEV